MSEFTKDLFLIWSYQHEAWWKPGSHGYTWDVEQAGLFEKAEAEAIVRNARGEEAMLPAKPTLAAFACEARRQKDEHLTRYNNLRLAAKNPARFKFLTGGVSDA